MMLCSRFPLEVGNGYLTNDLADAMVAEGVQVAVSCVDWGAPYSAPTHNAITENGVQVCATSPVAVRGFGSLTEKTTKWLLSPRRAASSARRAFRNHNFDLVIGFSPSVTIARQLSWAMKSFEARSYLVQWDFFPFHQRSLGLIPNGPIFEFARQREEALMRKFDTIGCMSPKNVDYLNARYQLRPEQGVEVLPIWSNVAIPGPIDRNVVRKRYGLPLDRPVAVFGGQITEGRGIEDMLSAAEFLRQAGSDIAMLFVGEGRQSSLVKAAAERDDSNVLYRPRIARDEYLKLLTAADVGLIATVRDVDVPTFPSKVTDYFRAGVPVVASVETSTDFGEFLADHDAGLHVAAGNTGALANAIEKLATDRALSKRFAEAGRACLRSVFDVRLAARQILNSGTRGETGKCAFFSDS
nr:glycosyltransferase family 4 protein [Aurantimonas marianensis]